ncbi:hypothetical protein WJX81_005500 [Elliptochloris bilobata]|uniref:Dynein heavy chain n=1 Tax=Elliptochloris bilobata TaxID=381761 RepID=A0AAW1S4L4_9CHLO
MKRSQMPRGSPSGKQTLTRFAAWLGGFRCCQPDIRRGYSPADFRQELKDLYEKAGLEGERIVFLLTDTQITHEAFLEDINNLLNSGEVPGMFGLEDKQRLAASMRERVEAGGQVASKDACYAAFLQSARDNLHCVLAMSPMCVDIHISVNEASERFFTELCRRHYTTPQSYLDLIELYKSLLKGQRSATGEARERLLNGLAKLSDTNEQVEQMRGELSALQPVILEKSQAAAAMQAEVLRDQASAEAAAVDSLNALNKGDVIEIKSMIKPPPLVLMVMEAVCVLRGEKPDWDTAKKVLGEPAFMRSLLEFDKDNIPESIIRKLRRYVDDPAFTPEAVAKQSRAAQSLCLWARAMDTYHRVSAAVAPKRAKLRSTEAILAAADAQLHEKQATLRAVEDRVAALQLRLAGVLEEQAEALQTQADLLVGDTLISAACIAYYGAFTGPFRAALVATWIARCQELGIPVSPSCMLRTSLAPSAQVREWHAMGLPHDDVSVDSAIVAMHGRCWPLCIDPQGQAAAWLRAMEAHSGLRVLRMGQAAYLRDLESALRAGTPVLFEDVGETLDPALEPLLLKQVYKDANGRLLLKLGDIDIDFNPAFRLYLTSRNPNPHFLPEVCIRVTVINFTVTAEGLEEQLLGDCVRRERPDLEEQRDSLLQSIAADKRQLQELEERMLRLLREAGGSLLDDEALLSTLNNSRSTSAAINTRVIEAQATEASINAARESYRPAAARASTLYFVVSGLSAIDTMYQTSLAHVASLFNRCVETAPSAAALPDRLANIAASVTRAIFATVQRGLFEEHKLLFAFLLAAGLQRASGKLPEEEWAALVGRASGAVLGSRAPPGWSSKLCWGELLTSFQRLLVVKALCEEALPAVCGLYVEDALGTEFMTPPPWTLGDVFPATTARTPTIFILSPGADPTAELQRFAEANGRVAGESLQMVSLGQGQGPVADTLVAQAARTGQWVCLQNCHLAVAWLPRLEALVEELASNDAVHAGFRLWLSSMPSPAFPTSVLQAGLKLAVQPPRGIRATLARTYAVMADEAFEASPSRLPGAWKNLLFGISFFHATVQERRKYGALGWNCAHAFNITDLEAGMMMAHILLRDSPALIPWSALQQVLGAIVYGGRIIDAADMHVLMALLRRFVRPALLDDGFSFASDPAYSRPPVGSLQSYREYISNLPAMEPPEVFGLHSNAALAHQRGEARRMLATLAAMQPRAAVLSAGGASDTALLKQVAGIRAALPPELEHRSMSSSQDKEMADPLAVVLRQELLRYQRLEAAVRGSLEDLERALQGRAAMSTDLEQMSASLSVKQVPLLWQRAAYPSQLPLGAWLGDFAVRMTHMQQWLRLGQPATFWLPCFFFPQGFVTAVLQAHARKHKVPIDAVWLSFKVTEHPSGAVVPAPPGIGVYVDGLTLIIGFCKVRR